MKQETKWILGVIGAAALLTAGTAAADEGIDVPFSVSGDVGAVTKYIFRAQSALGNQSASVQGSLNVVPDALPQLSVGAWYSTIDGQNNDEIDFIGDFTQEVGDFSFSLGSIGYTFVDNGDASAVDVYGGLGWGPLSTTLYYTVMGDETSSVLADDDIWREVSGEAPSIAGIVPALTLQMARYGESTEGSLTENDDFQLIAVVPSLSKTFMEFVTVSLHYSVATGENRNDQNINNEFWAGFFLSF
jgi:hypothetical protein